MADQITNLEQLLDKLGEAADDRDRVALGTMLGAVGTRSFGPLLLFAGVISFSPLSGIPGVPTVMATLVLLIAVQLLLGRDHFWLPDRLLKRSISNDKVAKALKWMRPPARLIDRWIKPRLTFLVKGPSQYVIASLCVVIGLGMPVMELVPFSATAAGAAITAFGLSLIAHDGLLASFAFLVTALLFGLIAYHVF